MLKRRTSVSSGSRWSMADMIHFIIAHLNRPVARQRVSLSSGIRMFARESETRGVSLKSVFLYRAELRIPNQSKRIRLTADCREFVR